MTRSLSGGGLACLTAGSGPPVIFIHGWSMASGVWARQIDYFSQRGFNAQAIDLPGHGDSPPDGDHTIAAMSDRLYGFIEEAGYEAPLLVGWSMGAMVILSYIEGHADRTSGICLVGGTPRFISGPGYDYGLDIKDVKGMKVKLRRDFLRCLGDFRKAMTKGLSVEDRDILIHAPYPQIDAAMTGLEELIKVDLRATLDKLRLPVLIIHGEDDHVCPAGVASYMEEKVEGAERVMFESAGHVPFLSHSRDFNERLEEFAGRILRA